MKPSSSLAACGLLDAQAGQRVARRSSGSVEPLSPRVVMSDPDLRARGSPPGERPAGGDLRVVGMGVDGEDARRRVVERRRLTT